MSLKLNAFLHQAKEHPRDFFFLLAFPKLKEKNEHAGIEIIVFIQCIELRQMEPLT